MNFKELVEKLIKEERQELALRARLFEFVESIAALDLPIYDVGVSSTRSFATLHTRVNSFDDWKAVRKALESHVVLNCKSDNPAYGTVTFSYWIGVGYSPLEIYVTVDPIREGASCRKVPDGIKEVPIYKLVCEGDDK